MLPAPAHSVLHSRPLQIVGLRSFSLYLVHAPLIVAVAFALGGRPTVILLTLISLPLIAATTAAFYRWVERPSQRWARWAGE